MSVYTSEPASINYPAGTVYAKLSDPSNLEKVAEKLPEDARQKLKDVSFTNDSITFAAGPAGNVELKITEKQQDRKVVYEAVASPLPLKIIIDIEPKSESSSEAKVAIDADIPVFLKPMIGGYVNQALDKFRELLGVIPYGSF